jgi:hypothetical protein
VNAIANPNDEAGGRAIDSHHPNANASPSGTVSTRRYRRTSISGTKKAQITFPLRHFFPLKVVK